MKFFVEKVVWEYGEKYGDVFFPKDIVDFRGKITELDLWGREKDYPFLVAVHFTDDSYLAFTIAHHYSYMEFAYSIDEQRKGPFYLNNPKGDFNEIVPIFYMASYSEPDTTQMLPYPQVLEAVYHYIEYKKFPSFIKFDSEEVNEKFVTP